MAVLVLGIEIRGHVDEMLYSDKTLKRHFRNRQPDISNEWEIMLNFLFGEIYGIRGVAIKYWD